MATIPGATTNLQGSPYGANQFYNIPGGAQQTVSPGVNPYNPFTQQQTGVPGYGYQFANQSQSPYGNPFVTSGANPIGALNFGVGSDMWKDLTKAFGGTGTALNYFLLSGAGYNPQVYSALVNQMQPQVQQGIATLGASAGAAGDRFSSGYEVGLGDYLSQVQANDAAMAANLYQQSVQNALQVTESTLPYIYQERNKPSFLTSLLGGLASSFGGAAAGTLGTAAGGALAGLIGLNSGSSNQNSQGFQGGVFNPGGTFGSNLPPNIPTSTATPFPNLDLTSSLQTPTINTQQDLMNLYGLNFSGATGSNILSMTQPNFGPSPQTGGYGPYSGGY